MQRINQVLSRSLIFCSVVLSGLLLHGCEDQGEKSGPAQLVVTLVDSPADYKAVNIDLQKISLKTTGTEEEGWIHLEDFKPDVYNLLNFTGGNELTLANKEVSPGNISQIRLILGQNNTLRRGDYTSKLLVPSGSSSGIKINVDYDISPGTTHYLKLDFDAARSVVRLGNTGQYILKPVIRLIAESSTGGVSGKVIPADENILINIFSGNSIIASSYAPEDASEFLVPGIAEGVYSVSLETSEGKFQKFIRDVGVNKGQITDLGTIDMNE